ncbi:MAG: hypothetical protein AMS14_01925 [Planctomycetes bacterium DG_20]|nr:MAG: hypothetical protein AMS14_01925 [Planctomycetes bacterium DG_20]
MARGGGAGLPAARSSFRQRRESASKTQTSGPSAIFPPKKRNRRRFASVAIDADHRLTGTASWLRADQAEAFRSNAQAGPFFEA